MRRDQAPAGHCSPRLFCSYPSHIFGQTRLGSRRHSKPVALFVLRMVVMASNPGKLDTVFFKKVEKFAP